MSKSNHQTAGFSRGFHLPEFHFLQLLKSPAKNKHISSSDRCPLKPTREIKSILHQMEDFVRGERQKADGSPRPRPSGARSAFQSVVAQHLFGAPGALFWGGGGGSRRVSFCVVGTCFFSVLRGWVSLKGDQQVRFRVFLCGGGWNGGVEFYGKS